ncbi:MAG: hypothetical protein ACHQAZ_10010, partial [Gammaproteobacteria bacterium]
YDSHIPYCGEGEEGDSSLGHDGVVLKFFSGGCTGAGAVEKSGWRLLAAERYSGEGEAAPADHVSVLDTSGQQVVKTIDFSASIIRLDPFTQQVWMIGPTGIMLLDASAEVKQRWYFYRDFGAPDHRPTLFLSDQPRDSDPFAAIAWALHIEDTEGWYKTVEALPAPIRKNFTMYKYFMGITGFSDPQAPVLSAFVPFLIAPMMAHMNDPVYERVLGAVCHDPDPRVDVLLQKTQVSGDAWMAAAGKRCLQERAAKQPGVK